MSDEFLFFQNLYVTRLAYRDQIIEVQKVLHSKEHGSMEHLYAV